MLAYSARNRSASCRIPWVSNPKARRIEMRFPDPIQSGYLTFTALMMAGLDGIKNQIDPGAPSDKDLYDLPPEEEKLIPQVCSSLDQALEALDNALIARRPSPGLIHHSDQGVQYACTAYTEALKAAGIVSSMSRTGNPYDNARMESFFKTLKAEEVNLQEYTDLDEAREGIGTFITLYNERRLHSSLGYVPPAEFAAQYHQAQI